LEVGVLDQCGDLPANRLARHTQRLCQTQPGDRASQLGGKALADVGVLFAKKGLADVLPPIRLEDAQKDDGAVVVVVEEVGRFPHVADNEFHRERVDRSRSLRALDPAFHPSSQPVIDG
jgi:hypothetical protein